MVKNISLFFSMCCIFILFFFGCNTNQPNKNIEAFTITPNTGVLNQDIKFFVPIKKLLTEIF
jgi:hypothetical protein